MQNCCWNKKNGIDHHNGECLDTFGPQYRDATMAVTFTDGVTTIYKNVRVCINRPDNDGLTVNGTTLKFEASDTCFTVLGVRQYVYTIDDNEPDDSFLYSDPWSGGSSWAPGEPPF